MNNEVKKLNSLALIGIAQVKQDTVVHHFNQIETNKLIAELRINTNKVESKVDKLEDSVRDLNIAVTNLANSQIQTNIKIDKLAERLDKLTSTVDKLWRERWWYRMLPLSLLGFMALGLWQVISNWDSIVSFFSAMNTFLQQAK